MTAISFPLSEGALALPEAVQDQSVTLLRLPATRSTLVVTRAWEVEAGQQEAYLQQQLAKVKRDMKKFSAEAPEDTQFGGIPRGKWRCVSKIRGCWWCKNCWC